MVVLGMVHLPLDSAVLQTRPIERAVLGSVEAAAQ